MLYNHVTAEEIPYEDDSAVWEVFPKPGRKVVAVKLREGATLHAPGQWWDAHVTKPGTYLMGSEPADVYPNDETEQTYIEVEGKPDPDVLDSISSLIPRNLWEGEPVVMMKSRPIEVIGIVAELTLETAEGNIPLEPGDIVVRSTDRHDRVWRIKPDTYDKIYGLDTIH